MQRWDTSEVWEVSSVDFDVDVLRSRDGRVVGIIHFDCDLVSADLVGQYRDFDSHLTPTICDAIF